MGKWRRKNKNKKKREEEANNQDAKKKPAWDRDRNPALFVDRGNYKMEAYYAYQGMHNTRLVGGAGAATAGATATTTTAPHFVPCCTAREHEDERHRWITSLKSILPISFRIGQDIDAALRQQLEHELDTMIGGTTTLRIEVEPRGGDRDRARNKQRTSNNNTSPSNNTNTARKEEENNDAIENETPNNEAVLAAAAAAAVEGTIQVDVAGAISENNTHTIPAVEAATATPTTPPPKIVKYIAPVRTLDFVPNGYQLNIDKQTLRRNTELKPFHTWLKIQTEAGFVTRQEAVSMLPPVVLAPRAGDRCLDLCAAPGSKTSQLLEWINRPTPPSTKGQQCCFEPAGCVVANDADTKRANMLVHQMKRINSPAIMITNCDARFFPLLRDKQPNSIGSGGTATGSAAAAMEEQGGTSSSEEQEGIFDRVLCDVPCSGDGTARKNPGIWKQWSCQNGLVLHPLQIAIAIRGAQSCTIGGRVCYSTCSMNPIENEAVVAELLRLSEGSLRLLDYRDPTHATSYSHGLLSRPGFTTWKVLSETQTARELKNKRNKNKPKMLAKRKEWAEKTKHEATAAATKVAAEKMATTSAGNVVNNAVEDSKITVIETGAAEAEKKEETKQKAEGETQEPATQNNGPRRYAPTSLTDEKELKELAESTGMVEYLSYEDVPQDLQKRIKPTCFPPTQDEISKFQLERCMRILPHDMDTGGFFVALFEKVAPLNARARRRFEAALIDEEYAVKEVANKKDDDKNVTATNSMNEHSKKKEEDDNAAVTEPKLKRAKVEDDEATAIAAQEKEEGDTSCKKNVDDAKTGDDDANTSNKKQQKPIIGKEDFRPVPKDILKPLKDFYGLESHDGNDFFDCKQFHCRGDGESRRVVYFVTNTIQTQLIDRGIQNKLKVINTGLKAFVRNNKDCEVMYRLSQEGIHFMAPYMNTKRKLIATQLSDFELCLSGPVVRVEQFSDPVFAERIRELSMGSFAIVLDGYENDYIKKLVICCWKCRGDSINHLVAQTEIDGIRSKIRSIEASSPATAATASSPQTIDATEAVAPPPQESS